MTEYDFSPEAYERHLATQQRIANWVDDTEAHAHEFRRPVPSRSGSDDSVVTIKASPERGQMPYTYYRSGPPPGGFVQQGPAHPPPPPPYHPYSHRPSRGPQPLPALDIPYAPVPGPMPVPPPQSMDRSATYPPHMIDPRASMQTAYPTSPPPGLPTIYTVTKKSSRHSSSRRSRSQAPTYILPSSPPLSPGYPPPPPGSFRSFTPVSPTGAYPPSGIGYLLPNPSKKSRSKGSGVRVYYV